MANKELKWFYNSKKWKSLRENIIAERGNICEDCGKIITSGKDIHAHHIIELNNDNVFDNEIALNPDNIRLLCRDCHDKPHKRFKYKDRHRQVFIVYGPPCSGKTSYVIENKSKNDIVVDMDRLFQAVSLLDLYDKPDSLKYNVFAIKNTLIDNIKTRAGNFDNAYIIGGFPNAFDRERLAKDLSAELIFIDESKEECLSRLYNNPNGRNIKEWKCYIENWFENYFE